jgi:ribosomal protein L29
MTKYQEYEAMSLEELQAQEKDLIKSLFEMTNELRSTRKLEKSHLLRSIKKDRARILTAISSKGK